MTAHGGLGPLSRARFIAAGAALAALASGVLPRGARAAIRAAAAATVDRVEVVAGAVRFAGDRPLFATLSPGSGRGRDSATLHFRLGKQARVLLTVVARSPGHDLTVAREERLLDAGLQSLVWQPPSGLAARTYTLRLSTGGGRRVAARSPVVRILGVDAAFAQRSYAAGETALLTVASDARQLTVTLLQSGPEQQPTYANNLVNGVPVGGAPLVADWSGHSDAPAAISLPLGDAPTGLYFARVDADDGRVGFAPVVVRPAAPTTRVAVFLPTTTWQAYNFYDADGDGYGDSWYVQWRRRTVDLARPYLNRGVPYRFRSYDLSFLHWLHGRGYRPDFYSDEDFERFADGDALAAAYDLLIFPGHTEYVTTHAYDVVERFRDLGGNLCFLSANNFFRRVDRRGDTITLVDTWRSLGRPEAALCGVQYRAGNRGESQQPYVAGDIAAASWAFQGTGLVQGATFGRFGIEVDATTSDSPAGTVVLARIPDSIGPGLTAEMSYYETPSGARVFAAGALNFGGQIGLWPETATLLDNVWARLTSG